MKDLQICSLNDLDNLDPAADLEAVSARMAELALEGCALEMAPIT